MLPEKEAEMHWRQKIVHSLAKKNCVLYTREELAEIRSASGLDLLTISELRTLVLQLSILAIHEEAE